jgi:N-acetylmuramoyl-L-alanine amidase
MEKLTAFIAALTILFSSPSYASLTTALQKIENTKIVCIDPGHGGDDSGAVSGDLTEAEVNLNIAKRLQKLLIADNYAVIMTRDDANTTLTNSQRAQICDDHHADLLVAIHLNANVNPAMDYTQTLYGTATKDKAFATTMHQSLLKELGIGNPPKADDAVTDFDDNLLLKAKMPATLVETVFITSPTEDTLLSTGSRQQQIAQALYEGITTWVTTQKGK